MKTVLGVFHDRVDVESAIDKFKNEGFKPEDFSIVMKEYSEGSVTDEAILLAVPTRENQLDLVMTIFDDCNASDIKTVSQQKARETHHTPSRSYAHAHAGAKGGKAKDSHKGKVNKGDSQKHAETSKSRSTKEQK